jgi:hypothetical protein
MAEFGNCHYGFEDGHIVSYTAEPDKLTVVYEFWNEKRGRLIFDGFVGLRDYGALGFTIRSTKEEESSQFITDVLKHYYKTPPENSGLKHFIFLDTEDYPALEVVAAGSAVELS